MFLEPKSTRHLPKKKKKTLRIWRRLKRSKSLKSCPILVWETRSSVARSASIAASTAIVWELGFGEEWSTQQQRWLSLLQATAFPVFLLLPPCVSVTKQSCSLSLSAAALHGLLCSRQGESCPKQLCLRPTSWTLCGILTLTSWLICYLDPRWGYRILEKKHQKDNFLTLTKNQLFFIRAMKSFHTNI